MLYYQLIRVTVLAICCITDYSTTLCLKIAWIYPLTVSVHQEFRHSLAVSSGSGCLMRLWSRCHLELHSSQGSTVKGFHSLWADGLRAWLLMSCWPKASFSSLPCVLLHKAADFSVKNERRRNSTNRMEIMIFCNLISEVTAHPSFAVSCLLEASHQLQPTFKGRGLHKGYKHWESFEAASHSNQVF